MLKTIKQRFFSNLQKNKFVKIVEVGPRDGLQNEKRIIETRDKLELIQRLVHAGIQVIESTAFVSPKWVPQMADHKEIFKGLESLMHKHGSSVSFPVLCPNMKGLEACLESRVKEIAVFGAASETFCKKNINCTIAESLDRFTEVTAHALSHNLKVRGYVSTVIACPYEGKVDVSRVVDVAKALYEMGCYEISLGDTIGVGRPNEFKRVIEGVAKHVPIEKLAVHCHDTYGMAIANITSSLEMGIRIIDSSVAGLGGCPYAKGASGNVATEDVVYLLNGMGFETGIDLQELVKTGHWISTILQRPNLSKSSVALGHLIKM